MAAKEPTNAEELEVAPPKRVKRAMEVEKFSTIEEVDERIRELEKEGATKYVSRAQHKHFGDINVDLASILAKKHRLRFQVTNTLLSIPNDERPFYILEDKQFVCHLGRDHNKKKIVGNEYVRRRNTKKVDCPVVIWVKHIMKFPKFKLVLPKQRSRRDGAAKKVRQLLESGEDLTGQYIHEFYLTIPKPEDHKGHPILGITAGFRHQLEPRVVAVMNDAIHLGVNRVSHINNIIYSFVKKEFFPKKRPDRMDKRFFPTKVDVRKYLKRFNMSNADKQNTENFVSKWQQNIIEDFLYFRPHYVNKEVPMIPHPKACFKNNLHIPDIDQMRRNMANDTGASLLFCYQSMWQKRLMSLHGNQMTFLDPAHLALPCEYPLYFLVVLTNVGFVIVGVIILEKSSQELLQEALSVFRNWNPGWKPSTFMVSSDEDDASAIQAVFKEKGTRLHINKYHQEKAWLAWQEDASDGIENKAEVIKMVREISTAPSREKLKKALETLHESEAWKGDALLRHWFTETWENRIKQWTTVYFDKTLDLMMNVSYIKDTMAELLVHKPIRPFRGVTLLEMITQLLKSYLPKSYVRYTKMNVDTPIDMKKMRELPDFVRNSPAATVVGDDVTSKAATTSSIVLSKGTFVVSKTEPGLITIETKAGKQEEVRLGNAEKFPSCTCENWNESRLPCIHFFAVVRCVPSVNWDNFSQLYRQCLLFQTDYKCNTVSPYTPDRDVSADVAISDDEEEEGDDDVIESNSEADDVESDIDYGAISDSPPNSPEVARAVHDLLADDSLPVGSDNNEDTIKEPVHKAADSNIQEAVSTDQLVEISTSSSVAITTAEVAKISSNASTTAVVASSSFAATTAAGFMKPLELPSTAIRQQISTMAEGSTVLVEAMSSGKLPAVTRFKRNTDGTYLVDKSIKVPNAVSVAKELQKSIRGDSQKKPVPILPAVGTPQPVRPVFAVAVTSSSDLLGALKNLSVPDTSTSVAAGTSSGLSSAISNLQTSSILPTVVTSPAAWVPLQNYLSAVGNKPIIFTPVSSVSSLPTLTNIPVIPADAQTVASPALLPTTNLATTVSSLATTSVSTVAPASSATTTSTTTVVTSSTVSCPLTALQMLKGSKSTAKAQTKLATASTSQSPKAKIPNILGRAKAVSSKSSAHPSSSQAPDVADSDNDSDEMEVDADDSADWTPHLEIDVPEVAKQRYSTRAKSLNYPVSPVLKDDLLKKPLDPEKRKCDKVVASEGATGVNTSGKSPNQTTTASTSPVKPTLVTVIPSKPGGTITEKTLSSIMDLLKKKGALKGQKVCFTTPSGDSIATCDTGTTHGMSEHSVGPSISLTSKGTSASSISFGTPLTRSSSGTLVPQGSKRTLVSRASVSTSALPPKTGTCSSISQTAGIRSQGAAQTVATIPNISASPVTPIIVQSYCPKVSTTMRGKVKKGKSSAVQIKVSTAASGQTCPKPEKVMVSASTQTVEMPALEKPKKAPKTKKQKLIGKCQETLKHFGDTLQLVKDEEYLTQLNDHLHSLLGELREIVSTGRVGPQKQVKQELVLDTLPSLPEPVSVPVGPVGPSPSKRMRLEQPERVIQDLYVTSAGADYQENCPSQSTSNETYYEVEYVEVPQAEVEPAVASIKLEGGIDIDNTGIQRILDALNVVSQEEVVGYT